MKKILTLLLLASIMTACSTSKTVTTDVDEERCYFSQSRMSNSHYSVID